MTIRLLLPACIASWLVLSQQPAAQQNQWVYLEHVNLVPMDSERVVPDQTVTVMGSTILNIGPNPMTVKDSGGNSVIPAGAVRVDGRGKFLMPTLAEMHAHIPNDTAEAERAA